MANKFSLQDYLELLNKQDPTETDKRQLRLYGALIGRQINYNRRDEYFSLIKEFLAENTDPGIFRARFLEMEREDDNTNQMIKKDFELLSNISIDFELEEGPFSHLIDLIYNMSMLENEFGFEDENEIFEEEFEYADLNRMSEREFKVSIEKAFSNLKLFK